MHENLDGQNKPNEAATHGQQEERQAFLFSLSDHLRAETGVEAVGNRAVQMIAERLSADRVYLVRLTPGDDNIVITHETRRQDMPPLLGSYRGSDFPSAIKEVFERTIIYTDVRTDPRLTDLDRLSFAGLGAVGFLAASIRRGNESMIWAAGAVSTTPRSWTKTEITLFEDAVERTWAAVERAQAEEALVRSEQKYRTLFNSIDEGFCILEVIYDENQHVIDWIYREHNPALARLTGLSQNIVGKKASDIYQNLEPFWKETFGRVVREGVSERFEYSVADLGNRWFDVYAARVGGAGSRELVLVYNNITERKRQEQRQEFLLRLADALRVHSHALEVEEAVTRMALKHFNVERCYFATVRNRQAIVQCDARLDDMPSVAGVYSLESFPLYQQVLDSGRPFTVQDVATTGVMEEGLKQICLSLGLVSSIQVPVVKKGVTAGILCLVQSGEPSKTGSSSILVVGVLTFWIQYFSI
ncbi:MAG: PAS domain-containing protein [Williamsia sp.]|nr:PAS domain-containing protein [Williamsia sp.]